MNKEGKEERHEVKRERSPFGAMILIVVGLVLLLNNFNLLSWEIWQTLWRFWPVLLVIWGLQIMVGKTRLGNLITFVIGLFLIGFIFVYSASLFNSNLDKWLTRTFPCWSEVKRTIPQEKPKLRNKVFKCDPFDGSCQLYYR